jgi:hypothetical protein
VPDWPQAPNLLHEVDHLRSELRAEQEGNLLLQENLADLQLALEDRGWRAINAQVELDFSPEGRKALRSLCRSMAIANPLLKRGLGLRIGYIWGQGVGVRARATGPTQEDPQAQDVNAVVQTFWDDNASTLSDAQALEDHERGVATEGDRFLTCFTNPLTGSVRIRTALADEVVDIITNPDDRDDPWFYVRHVPQKVVEPGLAPNTTRTRSQILKVLHPAVGYWPTVRPKSIDGAPVRWDAPILHVKVNSPTGWRFGIPDVYASVAWARAYKEFLVDWAQLTKALSKIAWQATGATKSKAQSIAAKLTADRQQRAASGTIGPIPPVGTPGASEAGATVASTADVRLEAVSKSGATIDANSGKPLAGMAAAGLGVPVTMLLADPGVTGARAVAETLDLPTVLEMGMRRLIWQGYLTKLLNYVIDQAALAPRGALRGSLIRDDWGKLQILLAGDVERTLDWDWPPLAEVDPIELVKAIVAADETGKMPPLTTVRLLLSALGVENIDELLADMQDDQGRFIDPKVTAGQVAVDALRDGRDPAAAIA